MIDYTRARGHRYFGHIEQCQRERHWAAAIVAVVAAAVTTYMQVSAANAQAAAADAQAAAHDQEAALAIQASQIEAKSIQERAQFEQEATLQAQQFEADMAMKNAEFQASSAREIAALESASAQTKAEFESKSAAEIAALQAENVRQQGAAQSRESMRRSMLILAKRRALAGANGVALTSGSPLLAELDAVQQMNIEALNISRSAEAQAITTTRAAELRGEAGLQGAANLRQELTTKANIQAGAGFMKATDITTGARLEAELRVSAIKISSEAQQWSTIFKGRVQESESIFASRMARFSATNTRSQIPWMIVGGVLKAASSASSAAGGSYGGGGADAGAGAAV